MLPPVMQSMELDDEDKLDQAMPMPMDRPEFPCGLRICLLERDLEKLGLDHRDAVIGGVFHGHFMARVTHLSEGRVEAQIEMLSIESEDEENEEADDE